MKLLYIATYIITNYSRHFARYVIHLDKILSIKFGTKCVKKRRLKTTTYPSNLQIFESNLKASKANGACRKKFYAKRFSHKFSYDAKLTFAETFLGYT